MKCKISIHLFVHSFIYSNVFIIYLIIYSGYNRMTVDGEPTFQKKKKKKEKLTLKENLLSYNYFLLKMFSLIIPRKINVILITFTIFFFFIELVL